MPFKTADHLHSRFARDARVDARGFRLVVPPRNVASLQGPNTTKALYYKAFVVKVEAVLPLIDRETERERLEHAWSQAGNGVPQLVVLWGRRRVGKTFLLGHVAQGKRAVFHASTEQAEAVELGRFHETIQRDLGSTVADLAGGSFASWEAALRFLSALATDEPLLVVLDEVTYLARSTPGLASIVQAVWDHIPHGAKLMLVLTGSAVGFMEDLIGPGGALRGRPTLRLPLEPLTPAHARSFLPTLDPVAFIEAYAACGGYPLHLRAWDPDVSTADNLNALAGQPGGLLVEDARGILREELPQTGGYARILAAIGRGRSRHAEIANEAAQRIDHPLDILVQTGFVERIVPVGAPRGARATYGLPDPYLGFWFRVLYAELAFIDGGQGAVALARAQARWQTHLGAVFEDLARDHARRLVARSDLPEMLIGRWWAARGEPCEIDVLGLEGSRTRLVGEARWQTRPLGRREVQTLLKKLSRTPSPHDDSLIGLWGRAGADPAVLGNEILSFDAAAIVDG
jgi:AAA+ ATPase superfamily predicted ATPase